MTERDITAYDTPVILVGGGHVAWQAFDEIRDLNYPVIAVDAGAHHLKNQGIEPQLIIGDLDSVTTVSLRQQSPETIEITEQDSTDFEKALYTLTSPLFLAFGFWGGRLDHSLAALHVVTKYRTTKKVVLVDSVDLMFVPQGPARFSGPLQTRVSIVPLAPARFERSTGLKYPLDGLALETGRAIGVSNEISAAEVEIKPVTADQNNYGIVLPNTMLGPMLGLLTPPD